MSMTGRWTSDDARRRNDILASRKDQAALRALSFDPAASTDTSPRVAGRPALLRRFRQEAESPPRSRGSSTEDNQEDAAARAAIIISPVNTTSSNDEMIPEL
eukprot:GHVU01033546.1.p1 GENE.GHVU01033546.1~~GHVU01033546.1.p1  ORF type:complete len:102 (-),score=18.37 GHVU01033546.1:489-794(-)